MHNNITRVAVAVAAVAALSSLGAGAPGAAARAGRPAGHPVVTASQVADVPGTPTATGGGPGSASSPTYAGLAQQAVATLENQYYAGAGLWHMCVPPICSNRNKDWGADSLTYALYLHWQFTRDPGVAPIMNALTSTAGLLPYRYSDVPMWDSIADAREYQVTGNPTALIKAKTAFNFVATTHPGEFAAGACPRIYYQAPGGGDNNLKTLETGSNYVKAALLLYQITHQAGYLRQAKAQYAADRAYFLARTAPLYTVYVFDDGTTCPRLAGRYFASVNGNMIWAGYSLAQATGNATYLNQAIATAKAVAQHLGDATGVYTDLQAENDITEPLIEAMYLLATAGQQAFARQWLLDAASTSTASIAPSGAYGRFFNGPPPQAPVTAWQVNGGLTLAFAAAALDPTGTPASPRYWADAAFVPDDLRLGSTPVTVTFTGRAVALLGTIGEICCESGHARVFLDGRETYDRTGIWQNKSSSGHSLPGSVLFAWRWPTPGTHTIEIRPGIPNAKEGTSFFHMTGYDLIGPQTP